MRTSMKLLVALALSLSSAAFAQREVIHFPIQINMTSTDFGAEAFSAINRITLQNLSNIEQTVQVSIELESISSNIRTATFPLTGNVNGWTTETHSYHTTYNGAPRSVTTIQKTVAPKTASNGGTASVTFQLGCRIARANGLLCNFDTVNPPPPTGNNGEFNTPSGACDDPANLGARCITSLIGRFKFRTRIVVLESLGAIIASSFSNIFGVAISSEKMTVNEPINAGMAF